MKILFNVEVLIGLVPLGFAVVEYVSLESVVVGVVVVETPIHVESFEFLEAFDLVVRNCKKFLNYYYENYHGYFHDRFRDCIRVSSHLNNCNLYDNLIVGYVL